MRGLLPGYMVGEYAPKRKHQRYDGDFQECPLCGGQMHYSASLCHDCHVKQNGTFDRVVDRKEQRERQERFDLALQAGWKLEELYGGTFDPNEPKKDKLPTRQEIVNRMIENWWKKEGESGTSD